jgi:hypothetical protein
MLPLSVSCALDTTHRTAHLTQCQEGEPLANPAGDALSADEIAKALREIAGETGGEDTFIEDYAEGTCKKCGQRQKFMARMKVKSRGADPTTRLNALKTIIEHGYGKPGTAKDETTKVDLDIDITKLSLQARGNLRRTLIAQYPEHTQTWIG